jgi:peptidoglycan/xylan/chitin deacetylase (PgdA/CDA1 family)
MTVGPRLTKRRMTIAGAVAFVLVAAVAFPVYLAVVRVPFWTRQTSPASISLASSSGASARDGLSKERTSSAVPVSKAASTADDSGFAEPSSGTPGHRPPGIDSMETAPRPIPGSIPHLAALDPQRVAVWRVDTARKVVALTFDDGPGPYTPLVMDALESAHVPATFFLIGQHGQEYPDEVAAEKAAGFEVENHTWDHRLLTEMPYETILREITATEAVIGPTRFLRPPGGYYEPPVRDAAASLGMMIIRWDVDTRDWERQDVPWILSRVESEVHPGSIILMHDGIMPGGGDTRSATVAAIPQVVAWLRSQGYSFVTVDQLLTGGYGPPATTFYGSAAA